MFIQLFPGWIGKEHKLSKGKEEEGGGILGRKKSLAGVRGV